MQLPTHDLKASSLTAALINPSQRPVAVISHERSGTHLCMDSLRRFFRETDRRQLPFQSTHKLYWDLHERLKEPLPSLDRALRGFSGRPLLKLHFESDLSAVANRGFRNAYRELLARSDRVYVVRDARDVLVSYFHFRVRFDHGATDFSRYLRSPIRFGMRTVARYWADHVDGWLTDPAIHCVRFESMRSCYVEAVTELGNALGLTRNLRAIRPLRPDRLRLLRAAKRALGIQRSSAILPGAGRTGVWQHYFSERDKAWFKQEAGRRSSSSTTKRTWIGDGVGEPHARPL